METVHGICNLLLQSVHFFFPIRIHSFSITDGLGTLFAVLPSLSHPSNSLTTLCQYLSHKAKLNSIAALFLLPLSSLLRKCHHLQSRFISSVLLFSYSVQLLLMGMIFPIWVILLELRTCFNFPSAVGKSIRAALVSPWKSHAAFSEVLLPEVLAQYRHAGLASDVLNNLCPSF